MGRYYFQSQQRLFQHNGYSVLIKEWYNPWADSPGRPSTFWVYYVNKEKEMVLHILTQPICTTTAEVKGQSENLS